MIKKYFAFLLMLLLCACTQLKVVPVDPQTGHFPTSNKATVVINEPIDLDERKSLILVASDEFDSAMVKNIGYFDEVISIKELQNQIIAKNLTSKIPSVQDRIGLNNAAKNYKPFLWLKFETRGAGLNKYARYTLIDPLTMKEYFATETHLDRIWAGVNDQNNWYPMLNAFIDYIRQNSKTYGK